MRIACPRCKRRLPPDLPDNPIPDVVPGDVTFYSGERQGLKQRGLLWVQGPHLNYVWEACQHSALISVAAFSITAPMAVFVSLKLNIQEILRSEDLLRSCGALLVLCCPGGCPAFQSHCLVSCSQCATYLLPRTRPPNPTERVLLLHPLKIGTLEPEEMLACCRDGDASIYREGLLLPQGEGPHCPKGWTPQPISGTMRRSQL